MYVKRMSRREILRRDFELPLPLKWNLYILTHIIWNMSFS